MALRSCSLTCFHVAARWTATFFDFRGGLGCNAVGTHRYCDDACAGVVSKVNCSTCNRIELVLMVIGSERQYAQNIPWNYKPPAATTT